MAKKANRSTKPSVSSSRACPTCRAMFSNKNTLNKHLRNGSRFCTPRPLAAVPGLPPPAVDEFPSEMSMFASAVAEQASYPSDSEMPAEMDDISLDLCSDQGSEKTAALFDSENATHPGHSFMHWLGADNPGLLPLEDRFFSRTEDCSSCSDSDSSVESPATPPDFVPLPVPGAHDIDSNGDPLDYSQMYQSSKFSDMADHSLCPAQERLMNHIKENCYPPALYDFIHDWGLSSLNDGYDFVSPSARTVMKRMESKYKKYIGSPPVTTYQRLLDHLPPSPISKWDVSSQIRRVLSDPSAVARATWKFAKESDLFSGERVYGEFSSTDWWERADATTPEIHHPRHYLCPVSIFIDGAHLDQIGRMCVEPVILELLALFSEV
jgi:hypothetical protein